MLAKLMHYLFIVITIGLLSLIVWIIKSLDYLFLLNDNSFFYRVYPFN
jgi:cytochrome bd-type quinol oxidase subunit 1